MLFKFSTITFLILQLLLKVQVKADVHWGYEDKDGPAKWGLLDSAYAACNSGKYQSPIDLTQANAQIITNRSLNIHWPNLKTHGLNVTNNGHTLMVTIPSHTNVTMVRDDVTYRLAQFHIHTPSEHHISDEYFDMEIHFVMYSPGQNKTHVLGIVFEVTNKYNRFLNRLGKEGEIPVSAGASSPINSINFTSLFDEIGNFDEYWAYEGSLTTPPCTEGVRWAISRRVAQLNWKQFRAIRRVIKFNARSVQ